MICLFALFFSLGLFWFTLLYVALLCYVRFNVNLWDLRACHCGITMQTRFTYSDVCISLILCYLDNLNTRCKICMGKNEFLEFCFLANLGCWWQELIIYSLFVIVGAEVDFNIHFKAVIWRFLVIKTKIPLNHILAKLHTK